MVAQFTVPNVLAEPLQRAHRAALPDGRVASPQVIGHALDQLAYAAYEAGRDAAMLDLCTTEEMAAMMGVDRSLIARRAAARGVGLLINRRTRVFSRARDLPLLGPRRPAILPPDWTAARYPS